MGHSAAYLPLVLSASLAAASPPGGWHSVAAGLEHRRFPAGEAPVEMHAFRADPAAVRIDVIDVHGTPDRGATAREMRASTGALVVVNGGFFDHDRAPLGLVVSGGRERNPLRRANWGIFALAGRPRIVHTRQAADIRGAEVALQCGPRLVVDGRPTNLKKQSARRTVVCIDRAGRVILAAGEGRVEASALAAWLARPEATGGPGCIDALNLDGGPSTQLSAEAGELAVELVGAYRVPNGLGFFAREAVRKD